ncbi:hypothetical protein Bbelb_013220 [Branchiostoma belcheri]|nr:hypothetical protein Bbelb_013220 [Branchiostoma belcheri]
MKFSCVGQRPPAWSLPGPLPPADQPAPPLRLFLRTTKPKRGVTAAHSARSACRVAWYVRIIQAVRTAVSTPADGMNRKIRRAAGHSSTRLHGSSTTNIQWSLVIECVTEEKACAEMIDHVSKVCAQPFSALFVYVQPGASGRYFKGQRPAPKRVPTRDKRPAIKSLPTYPRTL